MPRLLLTLGGAAGLLALLLPGPVGVQAFLGPALTPLAIE